MIELSGLGKSYGDVHAVRELNLSVHAGEVYGFLGRNGAGKTTTMRMLLGLIRPTSGSGSVFGKPLGDPASVARIGSLVESPAFYPHLSGRDNLRLLARYSGLGDSTVDSALELSGLIDRAGDRFTGYSLGMKQRLGVAAALMGDPELLILDEPTNGLDPSGMREMRDLVRNFADNGGTVLLSSHLLGEVEHVADRIGVIHSGRLVAEGALAEIRARVGGPRLVVRAEPGPAVETALRARPGVLGVRRTGELVEVELGTATAAAVNRDLVVEGFEVSELRIEERTLEDVFTGVTAA
ncbi:ATP-binding cassette domain-containing protein [Allokutzneria sp. A3M-2-11 16]|uniref:ABC transporter ATP-binding protein n=1 Tax=Allokutzneria sp. A3M-2-11 16 TaxID=2962043 RepID=UPI0020B845D4|nr:ATP-binding cassette domain-containing protein [Allokutzneria sp. A3M-2-11 16]MCP3800606.1 ATP-binding cassette domain-containing protein [Allokutzneria sp. A3M-2-11 16]